MLCSLWRTCQSQSVWKMRAEGAASPVVWKLQYPPPVLGAAPCSVLSGGNGILQPHDPCLALSFSGSLSFFHTHIYTQGEELWPLPSSNPQPTSPLLSCQLLFPFFSLSSYSSQWAYEFAVRVVSAKNGPSLLLQRRTSKQRYDWGESVKS